MVVEHFPGRPDRDLARTLLTQAQIDAGFLIFVMRDDRGHEAYGLWRAVPSQEYGTELRVFGSTVEPGAVKMEANKWLFGDIQQK